MLPLADVCREGIRSANAHEALRLDLGHAFDEIAGLSLAVLRGFGPEAAIRIETVLLSCTLFHPAAGRPNVTAVLPSCAISNHERLNAEPGRQRVEAAVLKLYEILCAAAPGLAVPGIAFHLGIAAGHRSASYFSLDIDLDGTLRMVCDLLDPRDVRIEHIADFLEELSSLPGSDGSTIWETRNSAGQPLRVPAADHETAHAIARKVWGMPHPH